MTITELTREMIADYEMMIGRKLTPQEYIQFRNQAMIEIQNGFGSNVQSVPIPMPVQIPTVIASEGILTKTEPEQILKKETRSSGLNSTLVNDLPKEPVSIKSAPKKVEEAPKETVTTDEAEDPFFALIDKMDA